VGDLQHVREIKPKVCPRGDCARGLALWVVWSGATCCRRSRGGCPHHPSAPRAFCSGGRLREVPTWGLAASPGDQTEGLSARGARAGVSAVGGVVRRDWLRAITRRLSTPSISALRVLQRWGSPGGLPRGGLSGDQTEGLSASRAVCVGSARGLALWMVCGRRDWLRAITRRLSTPSISAVRGLQRRSATGPPRGGLSGDQTEGLSARGARAGVSAVGGVVRRDWLRAITRRLSTPSISAVRGLQRRSSTPSHQRRTRSAARMVIAIFFCSDVDFG
jgi:hypothetical protein